MDRNGNDHSEWGDKDPEWHTLCIFFFLFADINFKSSDMCASHEMPIKGHEIIKDKRVKHFYRRRGRILC